MTAAGITLDTDQPTTLIGAPYTVDPARAVEDAHPRVSPGEWLTQTVAMAWRALKKMRRNPEQFFDVTVQPLLFTAMFAYIFGGAVAGGVKAYLPMLIPGIVAQTTLTSCMATGVQMREDMEKGVFDRFKSLPIARSAPLTGPALADLIRYLTAATLTFFTGILLGYRPSPLGVVGAIALAIVTGWSLAWIFTWFGTIARSAQAVQGISMLIMFPLTFLSNAFVPTHTLPGWLRSFVNVNPVSHFVSAARDLANHGTVSGQVGWTLVACAIVAAVFIPLAVRSYSKHL